MGLKAFLIQVSTMEPLRSIAWLLLVLLTPLLKFSMGYERTFRIYVHHTKRQTSSWILKNATGWIFTHPLKIINLNPNELISIKKTTLYSISTLSEDSSWLYIIRFFAIYTAQNLQEEKSFSTDEVIEFPGIHHVPSNHPNTRGGLGSIRSSLRLRCFPATWAFIIGYCNNITRVLFTDLFCH